MKQKENRQFGFLFAFVFFAVFWAKDGFTAPGPLLGLLPFFSIMLLLLTFFRPECLDRPRAVWMKFAHLLSKITQPIILGVLFYGVVTPVGFLRRRLGAPRIQKSFAPEKTYWTEVSPDDATPAERLRRQF